MAPFFFQAEDGIRDRAVHRCAAGRLEGRSGGGVRATPTLASLEAANGSAPAGRKLELREAFHFYGSQEPGRSGRVGASSRRRLPSSHVSAVCRRGSAIVIPLVG